MTPASRTLIDPGDPAPFVLLNEQATAPVLVVCDHASRAFPRAMGRLGLAEADSWRHVAWDLGAGELARGLADALEWERTSQAALFATADHAEGKAAFKGKRKPEFKGS